MSDTEETTTWYIKRLGGDFFKFVEMIFIKSSQKFSISLALSIGFRKFFEIWFRPKLSGKRGHFLGSFPVASKITFSCIGRSLLWIMLYGFES